jgi:hypothetical protein
MKRHYPGYEDALRGVETMNENELYSLLHALYGTNSLPENPTIDDLRREAYRQLDIDWLDPQVQ